MKRGVFGLGVACLLLAACGGTESVPGAAHTVRSPPVASEPRSGYPDAARSLPAGVHSLLGATENDSPVSDGITLARAADEFGQSDALVLFAPGIREVMQGHQVFAVLSGGTFSVTGDAAVDGWRFAVDPSAAGGAAPIVVLKFSAGSVRELVADPSGWADPAGFNDDVAGAAARLSGLVATVISQAEGPDGQWYAPLAGRLRDPNWNGVLIFHASMTATPREAQGEPIGPPADDQVCACTIGFDVNRPARGARISGRFFATVDRASGSGHGTDPGIQHLRALFENGALTDVSVGRD